MVSRKTGFDWTSFLELKRSERGRFYPQQYSRPAFSLSIWSGLAYTDDKKIGD